MHVLWKVEGQRFSEDTSLDGLSQLAGRSKYHQLSIMQYQSLLCDRLSIVLVLLLHLASYQAPPSPCTIISVVCESRGPGTRLGRAWLPDTNLTATRVLFYE